MKYFFLAVLIFASYDYTLAATGYTGSDFGTADTNSHFSVSSDCDGFLDPTGQLYKSDTSGLYLIFWNTSDNGWRVFSTLNGTNNCSDATYSSGGMLYYNFPSPPTPLDTSTFTVFNGDSPGGFFTETVDPDPIPTPPPTTSFDEGTTTCTVLSASSTQCVTVKGTSTVDNPVQDLFYGYMMMFITAGGIIWFFRRK